MHCEEMARIAGFGFHFLAQPHYMGVHGAGVRAVFVSPNGIEYRLARASFNS
jgi:hypothetical protein